MAQVLKELYQPLELMLFIAGLCTIADAFIPQLLLVPKATVSHVIKAVLSISFIGGSGNVLFNVKSRFCKENAWQCEMNGDITAQRRWCVPRRSLQDACALASTPSKHTRNAGYPPAC